MISRKNHENISEEFVIKNFILMEPSEIPKTQSLEQPFIFNGFVFGICLKGKAEFQFNYKVQKVHENEIFTVLPNQIFKVVQRSDDLMIEVLFLSADYAIQLPLPPSFDLLKKVSEYPVQKISREEVHDILEIHALIAKHHKNEKNPYRDMMTSGFIYALLTEIAYLYEGGPVEMPKSVSRMEVLTEKFFSLLIENYLTERNVAFYADKLCLTPKYLSTAVKKVTGHPIQEWINAVVIIESKRRLKATDHTVLQISEELNFANPSFFGRFFRQYAGMTPLKYRNS